MEKNELMAAETPGVSQQGTLTTELFLNENYRFRRNRLNGKVEFLRIDGSKRAELECAILPEAAKTAEGLSSGFDEAGLEFRPLTKEALNSIVIRAKREGGQNHIARIFSRLPGLSSEQLNFLTIWLRSAVAHWLQMDMLHGNECVPTLIGDQGCGKTTFVRRLLPASLREYYLDHLNLSNKFDKEMALTNNLLVNLDELDAIRPSQQSSLKQTLSVSKVNGRPIFGRTQEDRPRFASFVATTNNRHPLKDSTGSRRYICIQIPDGQLIDNTGEIDYGQLYAQVIYELQDLKAPYWFDNQEVARIQELNQEFMEQKDLGEMFVTCFRKPNEGEAITKMNCNQIISIIQKDYPSLQNTVGNRVRLGKVISALGFNYKDHSHINYYEVVPLRAA